MYCFKRACIPLPLIRLTFFLNAGSLLRLLLSTSANSLVHIVHVFALIDPNCLCLRHACTFVFNFVRANECCFCCCFPCCCPVAVPIPVGHCPCCFLASVVSKSSSLVNRNCSPSSHKSCEADVQLLQYEIH